jgi:hypothetical protein
MKLAGISTNNKKQASYNVEVARFLTVNIVVKVFPAPAHPIHSGLRR